jgi:hypothetical protein
MPSERNIHARPLSVLAHCDGMCLSDHPRATLADAERHLDRAPRTRRYRSGCSPKDSGVAQFVDELELMEQQEFHGFQQPTMVFRETWIGLAVDLAPAVEQGDHLLLGGGHLLPYLMALISAKVISSGFLFADCFGSAGSLSGSRVSAPTSGAEASERAGFSCCFFATRSELSTGVAAVGKEEVITVVG